MTCPDASDMTTLAVSMRDLHVAWDDTLILHGINLDIPAGQDRKSTRLNSSHRL